MNFVIEGFYTHLTNPFIFANQEELPGGVAVLTKSNGDGASVSGVNIEANVAFGSKLVLQSGATIQKALYDSEEVLWTPEVPLQDLQSTTTNRLLRTPNAYGYFSLVYTPFDALTLSYSGVMTGSMYVPQVIDAETEKTIIKSTPTFFENNIKVSLTFQLEEDFKADRPVWRCAKYFQKLPS